MLQMAQNVPERPPPVLQRRKGGYKILITQQTVGPNQQADHADHRKRKKTEAIKSWGT